METPTRPTPRARAAVFKAPQTPSRFPKTPTSRHSHLQDPSSSLASSPMSSPARIVNLVSSPGPMRAAPQVEEDPDELPYTLPPGPFSREKPDNSYAAIIGQAILSSPENRLALQDIYEWITTVYPYYQRGEQTWMNSVRHALSTMAVFRKVPRTRMEGKSLWAIFDHDLPCFAGGGFRKSLCADMVKVKTEASKPGPKKRGTMEEALSRNSKRRKTTLAHDVYGNPVPPLMSGPVMTGPVLAPFYAHVLPGTHHQPYYGTYLAAQPLPAEVVFPPLPPSSNYHQLVTMKAASASTSSRATSVDTASAAPSSSMSSYEDVPSSHEPSPAPASSSVPELSPDEGSSSSPPMPDTDADPVKNEPEIADPDADFEKWLAADPEEETAEEAVAPHMTLLRSFSDKNSPERTGTARKRNGKVKISPRQKLYRILTPCLADARFACTHIAHAGASVCCETESRRSNIICPPFSALPTRIFILIYRNASPYNSSSPALHTSTETCSQSKPASLSSTDTHLAYSLSYRISRLAESQPRAPPHALPETRSLWQRARIGFRIEGQISYAILLLPFRHTQTQLQQRVQLWVTCSNTGVVRSARSCYAVG